VNFGQIFDVLRLLEREIGLPVAAYLTWLGNLLEGKGVSPDTEVPLPTEDLRLGRDPQLERAIEALWNE
jgi:C-terminal processing protease CtpA/Prc